jgi:hypothetical protein
MKKLFQTGVIIYVKDYWYMKWNERQEFAIAIYNWKVLHVLNKNYLLDWEAPKTGVISRENMKRSGISETEFH